MEDQSMNTMILIILALIGLLFIVWFVTLFTRYKKQNKALHRAHEMSASVEGTITDLVRVTHRNRSFRWKNEYPIITYTVNGKSYETALDFAEKRKGNYEMNARYQVYYIPEEPQICIVDEFRSKMQSSNRNYLIGMVVLAFFLFNIVFTAISELI